MSIKSNKTDMNNTYVEQINMKKGKVNIQGIRATANKWNKGY